MSLREATAQQTDPLGALNQRPITLVLAVFAVLLAGVRSVESTDPETSTRFAVLAVVLVASAAAIMLVSSSPYRAPFTRRRFVAIVSLTVLAAVAEAASTAGHDVMIRDDWGGAAIGLLLLASSPYRPARDIAVASVVAAVVIAVIVFFELPTFATTAPAGVYVTVGVTPVLALGIGSAVYSHTFVTLVDHWIGRATTMTEENALELRPGIARSVQQDRVTGLNRDVVPLFTEIVEQGYVTEADRDRAREVAETIRSRIVAEADRSWLEQVLLDVCPRGKAGTVVDRAHLASRMTSDQRTAVRALVVAMAKSSSTTMSTLGIVLHDDDPLVRALVRVDNQASDAAIRQQFAPYFAVLRILFHDLQVDVNGSYLTLRFSYDQH